MECKRKLGIVNIKGNYTRFPKCKLCAGAETSRLHTLQKSKEYKIHVREMRRKLKCL